MTRVAYLGPAGTFTEEAARSFRIDGAQYVPVESPAAALAAIDAGDVDYAVCAIENSVDGAVTTTMDALAATASAGIVGETELAIAFAIMTRPGQSLDRAKRFATHPVAQQQVKRWVGENLPQVEFIPASSNAAAAEMVANGDADVAAAPERAADLHGLEIHARGVADLGTARTRFVLVAKQPAQPAPTGDDRTAIVFRTKNEPGALVRVLQEFAARGVDMTRIESRPTREEPNTYDFFVDLAGHADDAAVASALEACAAHTTAMRQLGTWPRTAR
ncbi:prephenate dehydratase [Corynebacterium fournieri]|uniref:prephenate dehydratase n=1 Tax=Corynebacterium fournieri TaxID=1852390 RepID=UPI000A2EDC0B|nr:prephenate dehydratase [Corynebacterium fournieri]WJY98472.1 Prephenate dehydratase [Corynebacterium fournieri]